MSPRHKTKDLKSLQKEWTEKLKRSGFEDIEQKDGRLQHWASSLHSRYDPIFFTAREEYYRLAGQFLHEHPFESPREMLIWELHSEGLPIREIVTELRKRRIYMKRFTVHKIVRTFTQILLEKIRKSHD